jgi:hypothetical protein
VAHHTRRQGNRDPHTHLIQVIKNRTAAIRYGVPYRSSCLCFMLAAFSSRFVQMSMFIPEVLEYASYVSFDVLLCGVDTQRCTRDFRCAAAQLARFI